MTNSTQQRRWFLEINGRVAATALALSIVLVPAFVATRSALRRVEMIGKRLVISGALAVAVLSALLLAVPAQAQQFTTLHSFGASGDVAYPESELVFDKTGNLYGEAYINGIFKLSPSGGGWTEKVLYAFSGSDGSEPQGTFAIDAKDNLYGVTWTGGVGDYGTVFEITPGGSQSFLYRFGGPPDGAKATGLIRDKKGNLFGTTAYGGTHSCPAGNGTCGTVFEVTKKGKESVLYSFSGSPDGYVPQSLVMDAQGNLFGTTSGGGIQNCPQQWGCGIVFELTPSGGTWTETIIYSFTGGTDGGVPGYSGYAPLIFDKLGNLYGSTAYGGAYGYGTVFKLMPVGGNWTETVLHDFNADGTDGTNPTGVVLDKAGNLYGGTWSGGSSTACPGGCGTVFEITKSGAEKILHSFSGPDGATPYFGLTLKRKILYGATYFGGDYGAGTAFMLKP